MKLDLNLYDHAESTIKHLLKTHEGEPAQDIAGTICGATQIPILGVYIIYGHYTGFTPEVQAAIVRLQKFYEYDTILGWEKYEGEHIPQFLKEMG